MIVFNYAILSAMLVWQEEFVMTECLFCKMVNGEIEPATVYEDDDVLAFRDIAPQAPFHALVIPRVHIASLNEMDEQHFDIIGKMFIAAKRIASREGFADAGFRTVMNCGEQGGQTVFHLHLHVLGGRAMRWPPG